MHLTEGNSMENGMKHAETVLDNRLQIVMIPTQRHLLMIGFVLVKSKPNGRMEVLGFLATVSESLLFLILLLLNVYS